MAKIKKRKLCWEASESPQVIGYRLYWSEDGKVDYDSRSVILGNVTEAVLPDDLEGFEASGPIVFGISALDELGNESDIITLEAPYQFNMPKMPKDFWLETLDDFHTSSDVHGQSDREIPIPLFEERVAKKEACDAEPIAKGPMIAQASLKYTRGYDSA